MPFRIYRFLWMVFILLPVAGFAQDNARLINFYNKWGMLQDRQGYMWYVDNAGAVGRYLFSDPKSEADLFDEIAGCDFLNFIKEDREGKIWITTGCWFYRFDPVLKTFEDISELITKQTKYKPEHIESWFEDSTGTVWFGGRALISYSLKTKKIEVKENPSKDGPQFNLFGDHDQTIWYSDYSGGKFTFNHYDPRTKKVLKKLGFDINSLGVQPHMTVNVTTEKIVGGKPNTYMMYAGHALLEFDPVKETLIPIATPAEFGKPSVIGSIANQIYVGTVSGCILKFNASSQKFDLVWKNSVKSAIEFIFPAVDGNKGWACLENGLYPIRSENDLFVRDRNSKDSSLPPTQHAQVALAGGRVYLMEYDRLRPINPEFRKDSIKIDPPLNPEKSNYDIGTIPGQSRFWFLQRYYYFKATTKAKMSEISLRDSLGNILQMIRSPELDSVLAKNYIQRLMPDRNNSVLWMLAYNGAWRYEIESGKIEKIKEFEELGQRVTYSLVDALGNLWVTSQNEGLYQYSYAQKKLKNFQHNQADSNSISSDNLESIYEAKDGRFWIATKNRGISILDPKSGHFSRLDRSAGLPELIITDFTEDDKGRIWVATRQFLCLWVPEKKQFVTFRDEDGLHFDASYIDKVFFKENSGRIYLRTNEGISSFNPDSALLYQLKPTKVLLTGFLTNNIPVRVLSSDSILPKAVNFMDRIDLRYSMNKFTIRYAAVDFYGNVQYAYRLLGFEKEWQMVQTETEAIYTNTPPGDYVFQVKAVNHQGEWGEIRELPIKIRAPWYRTWLAYASYVILLILAVWAIIRYRSRYLIAENLRLEKNVTLRTDELSNSLKELKETQTQLIQKEKMASLGELTAGIAHEIQNPLNFVNNFSDVNRELIDDLNDELDRGNTHEVKIIAENLRENESKINHHGKRADAIVKSMLQHSRASTGQKELTDINALAEEYIRLSYHGLRAKDKSFNTSMQVELDPTIGKINIISQDIGRVLLNLFNNAFYAVSERQKNETGGNYAPAVSLHTIRSNGQVIINIKDNGGGIPAGIRDKIFQPFFTTKPTGEGTGLGLSLSYDIVKAHGGELLLNSEQDGVAEFIMRLPNS